MEKRLAEPEMTATRQRSYLDNVLKNSETKNSPPKSKLPRSQAAQAAQTRQAKAKMSRDEVNAMINTLIARS